MWRDDARRRRTQDHGYTISSPCEPEGSGELIILTQPTEPPLDPPLQSLLCDLSFLHIDSKDFDQTWQIWVFT